MRLSRVMSPITQKRLHVARTRGLERLVVEADAEHGHLAWKIR